MRAEAHEQAANAAADRATGATNLSHIRSGSSLDLSTRALMDQRFQHDFSRVRVHTDDAATASARNLNALAYTAGNDIVIGREGLALDSTGGHKLLAHELTHVVQQARGGAEGIQRKPLFPAGRTNYRFDTAQINADDLKDPEIQQRLRAMKRPQLRAYRDRVGDPAVQGFISSLMDAPPLATIEESWIKFDKAFIDDIAGRDYWWPRTSRVYDVKRIARFATDEEEEAVYAAVWGVWPDGPPAPGSKELVTIPPNANRKNALLYRVMVNPPAAGNTKPKLEFEFINESTGDVAPELAKPPSTYVAPKLEFSSANGFVDFQKWLKDHPEEQRQIAYWVGRQDRYFDELMVTRVVQPKGPPRETTLRLRGTRVKGLPMDDLAIDLVDDKRPRTVTPPDDYRSRDFADLQIHEDQTKPHAKRGDKLGHVNVNGVPAGEVLSVKIAISEYWRRGTRDAEVDAVLPIAGTTKKVFYSLHFHADLEVDVERIGEQGSSPKLDPGALDIARVKGFDENSSEPAKLKTWLGKRYPGVKPAGTTVAEVRDSANKAMEAAMATDVTASAWYESNYKIFILGGAAARTRLKSVHKLVDPQVPPGDMKSFTAQERTLAELSLQTLSDRLLPLTKSLRFGRQKKALKPDGTEKTGTAGGPIGGQTFWTGSERTIMVYDHGVNLDKDRGGFYGGAEGVHDPHTPLLTHEIGHSLEPSLAVRAAFNKFVKREGIEPLTAYAASDPAKEFFPEAFSVYQTDPEFLRRNHPEVFGWLDELSKTGKVPK